MQEGKWIEHYKCWQWNLVSSWSSTCPTTIARMIGWQVHDDQWVIGEETTDGDANENPGVFRLVEIRPLGSLADDVGDDKASRWHPCLWGDCSWTGGLIQRHVILILTIWSILPSTKENAVLKGQLVVGTGQFARLCFLATTSRPEHQERHW